MKLTFEIDSDFKKLKYVPGITYINSQNTTISLKPIHLFDKIKLILYQQDGNSMT